MQLYTVGGPSDYDLLVIPTCNLCGKYYPLTAMLIFPVITIFYIKLFWQFELKNGRQSTFLPLSQSFQDHHTRPK